MSRPSRIYLDLDGPICDMIGAALRRIRFPADFVWPPGVWDICSVVGMRPDEFWPRVADHSFWADEIQPTPYAHDLVNAAVDLVGIDRVRILSRPTSSPFSASGKIAWLQAHCPRLVRRYNLSVDKTDIGRVGDVLVDDSESNASDWIAAGGQAVLWPCQQNCRHAEDPAQGILELRRLFVSG